jgi:hypothetical protein
MFVPSIVRHFNPTSSCGQRAGQPANVWYDWGVKKKAPKIIKLNRYEKALLCLAYHVGLSHTSDWNVEKEILDILELEPMTKIKGRV